MDHAIKCLSANCRMAGPARTLRVHTADVLMVGKAIAMCTKGQVLAIDGQGELDTALWGILCTLTARLKGLEGVVIDGAIRDVEAIQQERFPVFARAIVPTRAGRSTQAKCTSRFSPAAWWCDPAIGLWVTKMEWSSYHRTACQ